MCEQMQIYVQDELLEILPFNKNRQIQTRDPHLQKDKKKLNVSKRCQTLSRSQKQSNELGKWKQEKN